MAPSPVYLVTGSRDFADLDAVRSWASALPPDARLIAGGARGVDSAAESAFLESHPAEACEVMRPDWAGFGRPAAFVRNVRMVKRLIEYNAAGHPVLVVAFWNGESHGTQHTISVAHDAGLAVEVRR